MRIRMINKTSEGIPDAVENAILNGYTACAINEACDDYGLRISEIEIVDDTKTYTVVDK